MKKRHLVFGSHLLSLTIIGCSVLALIDALDYYSINWIRFGMVPQTSFCFILISLGLISRTFNNYIAKKISAYFFNTVTLISFVVIIGYLTGVPELYTFSFKPMSVYAAFGFFLFSTSIALVYPTLGLTGIFTGKKIGNIMARRIFAELMIAIIILGYLHLLDHRYHWFSHEFGSAVQTIILMMVGLFIIWETSQALNKAEAERNTAQQNFKLAVQSAPYALVISDKEGSIVMVNNQTELLYGFKKNELVGKPLKLILPKKMHDDYDTWRVNFFKKRIKVHYGVTDEEEIIAIRKNNSEFPAEMVFIPIKIRNEVVCLTSIVDITDRKRYEDIIKQQVAELQSKNQELEQFNSIASHDLQEPLRTVSNYIKLLEEDYPEQINEEIKEYLKVMDAATGRMTILVKSLLDFGKLGRNKKMTLVDCNQLVKNVINDLSTLITHKKAQVTVVGQLPVMNGYETELQQLFQNLINNAVKFCRIDELPEISVSCEKETGYYRFSVTDNGIGIETEYCEKIFLIFQRLNKTDEYEGHGIGLANCKKIVEMHGGKIWAEPRAEGGTVFKFTIFNFKG
ncbi:PAS domain S-box protein [Flavobacterium salilacus subsp. salilacus]|uniref:sensor histidine kinase n=1 Tax=Flavobacterium TaxID=237 RepID=UPI0013C2ECEC|nr:MULTISPECIES: ATP-binding protein [Flavobacterium]KAF2519225.1 PAS domain S-box protein [Flavobacterium salilacus subsp. salilacus]MBE1613405.1 PAS domain S-box protein [Flavobacterium sp. SaA2.13]